MQDRLVTKQILHQVETRKYTAAIYLDLSDEFDNFDTQDCIDKLGRFILSNTLFKSFDPFTKPYVLGKIQ